VGSPESSRGIAEEWFATHADDGSTGYRKLVRVYGERILPMLGDWEGALRWIEGSEVLEREEKEALMERVRGRRAEKERKRGEEQQGDERQQGSGSPPTTEEAGKDKESKSARGGSRPEGEPGGGIGKKGVASPSRVCSPASVISSSSSSSLLTHSTHTAVPTAHGEEDRGRDGSGSGTLTPRARPASDIVSGTPRSTSRRGERIIGRLRVGALQGYLGRIGVIWLVMVLMGVYIGRRRRTRAWIRRQVVDFFSMAFRGLAL